MAGSARVRADGAQVDAFAIHGGRLAEARVAFPAAERWLDLSTGIAPWRYPFAVTEEALVRLPEPGATAALEAAAAHMFGVHRDRVVAVPGSDMALRLLGSIIPGRAASIQPGYSGHQAMWGGRAVTRVAQGDVLTATQSHDALVLARPNNPDGWTADADRLADAALGLSARGGALIVDEAFVDATPHTSVAGNDWPGLIVLRSFGKFFGLPGLRLGFVIAARAVTDELRALIGDWPVSGPALAAGCSAYADVDWQAAQRARLMGASDRLAALLTGHGLAVAGRTGFFVTAATPRRDALFVHLAEAGILTRPFRGPVDWIRFGLPGSAADWHQLETALHRWSSR
jgi:cobalamin biosynthetic protein CobC